MAAYEHRDLEYGRPLTVADGFDFAGFRYVPTGAPRPNYVPGCTVAFLTFLTPPIWPAQSVAVHSRSGGRLDAERRRLPSDERHGRPNHHFGL